MGHEPSTAPGVSPKLNCSCPALPQSRNCAAMRRSSLARPAPAPAGFKSQPVAQKHMDCSAMLGHCTLLLVLLALPTLAQQHSPREQGTALSLTASPHGALQGHRSPTVPPKMGECPAGASGAPWPPRLYCLSDHGCPGAEKCCQIGKVWSCLLPTTGTAAHSKGCQHEGRAMGGLWAGACVGAPGGGVPAPRDMAAWSISLCREPGLLPPCWQCRRAKLWDKMSQRHRMPLGREVLHPRLLHPLRAC